MPLTMTEPRPLIVPDTVVAVEFVVVATPPFPVSTPPPPPPQAVINPADAKTMTSMQGFMFERDI
jgi:hypothetical protein